MKLKRFLMMYWQLFLMTNKIHLENPGNSARSQALALVVIHKYHKARHSGRDCRNSGYMDVFEIASLALDTRFPAGMTGYLNTCV